MSSAIHRLLAKQGPFEIIAWTAGLTSAAFGSLWLLATPCDFERSSGVSEFLGFLDFYFSRLPFTEKRVVSVNSANAAIVCNYEKLRVLHSFDLALIAASAVILIAKRKRLTAWVYEKWPGGSARLGDYNLVPAILIALFGWLLFLGLDRAIFGFGTPPRVGESRWWILLDSVYVAGVVIGVTGAGARLLLARSRRASQSAEKTR